MPTQAPLLPLNTYVILELLEEESLLTKPDEDIKNASRGTVVDANVYTDIQVGDVVYFVWNASHGQITEKDGRHFAHVKHEHLLSKEI